MLSFATIMLLAGIGIPIMAAMTSSLGKHLNSPVAASAFAFFMAFCIALLALMITDKSFVKQIPSAPKYLFVAGAFIAFYVLSISFVAPHFGIGNAIFFVLLGQLLSAAIIDHYGLFGAQINHLSMMRVFRNCCNGIRSLAYSECLALLKPIAKFQRSSGTSTSV